MTPENSRLINGVHRTGTYMGKEILGLLFRKYQFSLSKKVPNQGVLA